VVIGDGIGVIPENTFYNCPMLETVVLGDLVHSIDNKAFYRCDSLTDVWYGGANRDAITIGNNNAPLTDATWHFNTADHTYKNSKCTVCGAKTTVKESVKKPKKVSSLKVKAGKKKMTVSWKKDSKAGGYEIKYATSKKFKKAKTVKIKSYKTAKKVISKLKSKKTYYVRIRTYKKSGSVVHISKWSKVKSVRAK
jgi:hypothetical protein